VKSPDRSPNLDLFVSFACFVSKLLGFPCYAFSLLTLFNAALRGGEEVTMPPRSISATIHVRPLTAMIAGVLSCRS